MAFVFPSGQTFDGSAPIQVQLWFSISSNPYFYAWAAWEGSVNGDDPSGMWGNLSTPFPLFTGMSVGTPQGGSVVGISLMQIHYPPIGLFANTDNPIMIWSGEWSSADLTPRTVSISTSTVGAWIYLNVGAPPSMMVFVNEAYGEIQVIPSPAVAAAFLGGIWAFGAGRRRE